MKELFIYNTLSGKGISPKKLEIIITYLKASYPNITICQTLKKGDAKEYTLKHIKDTNIIFVLGGDGTIHDIVSAIVESKYSPTICVIPNGTMNDLSHSLHIPKDYRKAIDLAKTKNIKSCNVLKVNDQYAIYATALGRFSSTSYNTTQTSKKMLGKLSYFVNSVKDAFHYQPISAKITVDGNTMSTKFSLLITCIGRYVAGFPINKNDDCDTHAKLILIREKDSKKNGSIRSIYSIIKLFILGINRVDSDNLTNVFDFKKIVIEPSKKTPIVLDGEKYESDKYTITLLKNQVNFVLNNIDSSK